MRAQINALQPESLRNCRDPDRLRTVDGRRVRNATRYRSDAPHPDHSYATFLAKRGLRSVIDLRANTETKSNVALPDVVTHRVVLVDPTLALLRQGGTALPQHESYLSVIEANAAAMTTAVRTASRVPKPLLIDCTARKDRTGVVVALLLSAIGVRSDDLAEDYAANAEAPRHYREQLPTAFGGCSFPAHLFECQPETILTLLDSLVHKHGGARELLLRAGLVADDIRHLESAVLIEEPDPALHTTAPEDNPQ